MGRRRCSLCGGKLVEHRCVECGLDNSKSDAFYRLNKSQCDRRPLTHVHKETEKDTPPTAKRIGTIISIIVAVITLVGPLVNIFLDWKTEYGVEGENSVVESEYDPYLYLEKELPVMGEEFDAEYEGGEYVVGVHVPEGQYQVEILSGTGMVWIDDYANNIFYSEYSSAEPNEDMVDYIDDFRLFTGAKMGVDANMKVRLISTNAQVEQQTGIANPLTESVELTGEMTAGEDFPAGVYDVSFRRAAEDEYGMGYLQYIVPQTLTKEDIEEYDMSTGTVLLDDPENRYCHVVLPEGTIVSVEHGIITLTPSEIISSEDYAAYYAERYLD